MSVLITSSSEIGNHQLNNSSAKAQFSFPKEDRFVSLYRQGHNNTTPAYFEGKKYTKLSSLKTHYSKFGKESKPDNIFVEINR